MFREALTKRLSAGMAEAILRKCDEQGENAIEYLIDFIEERADDAFYNALIRLCDEYDLPVFDNDDDIVMTLNSSALIHSRLETSANITTGKIGG